MRGKLENRGKNIMALNFSAYAVIWMCIGSSVTLLAVLLGSLAFKRLTIVKALWYLTYWLAGTGFLLQGLGVYYEITILEGEGLIMLVIGTGLLSLAGLFATGASKKQQEREAKK